MAACAYGDSRNGASSKTGIKKSARSRTGTCTKMGSASSRNGLFLIRGLTDARLANALTHTCGVTIVVRGPAPLAAIIMAHDCGGRLGSCHGLFVGLSPDDAIAAAHAVG
jgi:hypothetical protein